MTAIRYIVVLAGVLLASAPSGGLAAGNPAKGEKVFKKCIACREKRIACML